MKVAYHGRYEDHEEVYGAPWYFIHRVDLHNELRTLATQLGVDIQLNSEVIDANPEKGILTLKNGESHQKDLVIAADGVHVGTPTCCHAACD